MATSNGYRVPSKQFTVSEDTNRHGRWIATVTYRVKDGRKWREIVNVTLREKPKGTIELDVGSRGSGGRSRTGHHDRQAAIDQAVRQVETMGKRAVQDGQLDRTIYDGKGEITMLGGLKLWLDRKLEDREKNPDKGVTDDLLTQVTQACEIAVNMKGRDFRLAELVGRMDEFCTELMKYRAAGFTFDPELVAELALKNDGSRDPAHPTTRAKDARRVCEVVKLVATTVNPNDPDRNLLEPNPVATNGFEWPKEENIGQGKTPIAWKTQVLLLSPLKRGNSIEPAPLDQVDEDGATRLVAALMGHHGMRRSTPIGLQRKHIATTPDEVRVMINDHGRYLRNGDLAEYVERIWILHADTKMVHKDRVHYTRPVPCNAILEAELRRYFDRHDLWRADPEAYIFADPASDRTKPYVKSTFFKSQGYEKVKDQKGELVLNKDSKPIPEIGRDGLPVVSRRGGRFDRAFHILRLYLHEQGEDWTRHVPVIFGEGVHGYRTNLEEAVVAKGWIQIADVAGLEDQFKKLNLARYADYLLNRKMHASVRNERYAMLEPTLLLAVVDHEIGLKAAARLAEQTEEDEDDAMAAMARVAGL